MKSISFADIQNVPTDQDEALIAALIRFFGMCDGIVGHEANYQVMLAAQLEQAFPQRVRREFRTTTTGRGGIDVAVVDSDGSPWAVLEVKGGAYNSRSALKDEFRTSIPKDIATLAQIDVPSARRWIVAIDALREFGRSMTPSMQQVVQEDASGKGVCFAYFGHGEQFCTIAVAGCRPRYPDVPERAQIRACLDPTSVFSPTAMTRVLAKSRESLVCEADVVSAVYRELVSLGYAVDQVAAETYFAFAPRKDGGRMQERPDLCLFDPPVQGHFNLYPKGDTSRTYDALKFATWRTMIEFKGGAVLGTKPDSSLMKPYGDDIDKLGKWRRLVQRQVFPRDRELPPVDFVFVAVDLRDRCLDPALQDTLSRNATRQGVRFIYVHLPETHRSMSHAA